MSKKASKQSNLSDPGKMSPGSIQGQATFVAMPIAVHSSTTAESAVTELTASREPVADTSTPVARESGTANAVTTPELDADPAEPAAPKSVATPPWQSPYTNRKFAVLDRETIELARSVVTSQEKLQIDWDQLLAKVHEAQSFLSQRGATRPRGRKQLRPGDLPKWQDWLSRVQRESGISRTELYRRLGAYRERVLGIPPEKHATPGQPGRGKPAATSAAADHHASAGGTDHASESEAEHRADPPIASLDRSSASDTSTGQADDDLDWPSPAMLLSPLKSGDRSGLVTVVMEKCGSDIEAVLSNLAPQAQADTLKYLYWQILQKYCGPGRGDGQFHVEVTYTPPPPPELRTELNCPLPN